MKEDILVEHNRLFQEAGAIIKGHISLAEQRDLPIPGWLLTRRLKRAIGLYERALEINPENWSAMWFIGKVHQRLRNKAEALSWFERAYQSDPSQPDVAREASLAAMEVGRQDIAVVFAHRATQIEPANPSLRANLALAHLLAGRIADAETAIQQALVDDPSDRISKNILAMVQHFAATDRIPPISIPALTDYWLQVLEENNRPDL